MFIKDHELINVKGQDTRNHGGLSMTKKTGSRPNREKSTLIAGGGSFIAQVVRDHKTNKKLSGVTAIILYYPKQR